MKQTRKILIVDDEPRITDIIAEYLTNRGFEIEKAYGGQEGLDIIDRIPALDLVILDKKMPHVDGVAVMRHLKKTSCDIPVIVITGSISLSGLLNTRDIRYELVLPKPVRLSKLFEIANKVIDKKHQKYEEINNV